MQKHLQTWTTGLDQGLADGCITPCSCISFSCLATSCLTANGVRPSDCFLREASPVSIDIPLRCVSPLSLIYRKGLYRRSWRSAFLFCPTWLLARLQPRAQLTSAYAHISPSVRTSFTSDIRYLVRLFQLLLQMRNSRKKSAPIIVMSAPLSIAHLQLDIHTALCGLLPLSSTRAVNISWYPRNQMSTSTVRGPRDLNSVIMLRSPNIAIPPVLKQNCLPSLSSPLSIMARN